MKREYDPSVANDPNLSEMEKDGVQYFLDFTRRIEELSVRKFKDEIDSKPFSLDSLLRVLSLIGHDDVRFVPVIACAFADDILADTFREYLPISTPGGKSALLAMNGPLGSLANRVSIAYCFQMASPDILLDVDRLRKVRNKVSHSWSIDTLKAFFADQPMTDLSPVESFVAERVELQDLLKDLSPEEAFRFRVIWIVARLAYEAPLIWRLRQAGVRAPFKALCGPQQTRRLQSVATAALDACRHVKAASV